MATRSNAVTAQVEHPRRLRLLSCCPGLLITRPVRAIYCWADRQARLGAGSPAEGTSRAASSIPWQLLGEEGQPEALT